MRDLDVAALSSRADEALRRGDYLAAVNILIDLSAAMPGDVRLLLNLGGALKELGRFDEALPILSRAVSLDPRRFAAWSNLGTVSLELQNYDDALAAFSNAVKLKSDHVPALAGLGVALRRSGRPQQAQTFFDLAVATEPRNADVRTWRAMAYLAAGDYSRGFAEYEWRLHARDALCSSPNAPRWKGEPLRGRTLLVHAEGGLGDCLHFARYITLLPELGCRVVVQMPSPLVRLLGRMKGIDLIVSSDEEPPAFDLVCPVMSLPYVFGTTAETIPLADGYLQPDPEDVRAWQRRLETDPSNSTDWHDCARPPLRVGLVWSGGKRPWHLENTLIDRRRSMNLSDFEPLAAAGDNVVFYSLQVGGPQVEAKTAPHGLRLVDHTAEIADFADTAALVSHLDLVISVDTSTAHLAGGLGKPVWVLSRYDQCWRWIAGRTDTPWYNSMRIYTQHAPYDWSPPLAAVEAELGRLASLPRP